MARLRIDIEAVNKTQEGLADVERDAEAVSDRMGERMGGALSAALAGAITTAVGEALDSILDTLDDIEQRAQILAITAGRTTEAEKDLFDDLRREGFSDQAAATAVQRNRALGATGDDAALLGGVTSRLETAGINTRFVPQLADAFSVSDPRVLASQLGAAFDVGTQSGIDVEEIFSEIADNPQVYANLGSIPQAAGFVAQQGLIPSEVTAQIEQGRLTIPEGFSVTADANALATIQPTSGEQFEGLVATSGPATQAVYSIPGIHTAARGYHAAADDTLLGSALGHVGIDEYTPILGQSIVLEGIIRSFFGGGSSEDPDIEQRTFASRTSRYREPETVEDAVARLRRQHERDIEYRQAANVEDEPERFRPRFAELNAISLEYGFDGPYDPRAIAILEKIAANTSDIRNPNSVSASQETRAATDGSAQFRRGPSR